ncbi:MAG TPA: hypothetical protein VK861_09450, partial [Bacteroidales bacterium]|nr:hypothetical protein [Bacteroidales bacterium]
NKLAGEERSTRLYMLRKLQKKVNEKFPDAADLANIEMIKRAPDITAELGGDISDMSYEDVMHNLNQLRELDERGTLSEPVRDYLQQFEQRSEELKQIAREDGQLDTYEGALNYLHSQYMLLEDMDDDLSLRDIRELAREFQGYEEQAQELTRQQDGEARGVEEYVFLKEGIVLTDDEGNEIKLEGLSFLKEKLNSLRERVSEAQQRRSEQAEQDRQSRSQQRRQQAQERQQPGQPEEQPEWLENILRIQEEMFEKMAEHGGPLPEDQRQQISNEEIEYYRAQLRGYEFFIGNEEDRLFLNPESFVQNAPPWYLRLEQKQKETVLFRLHVNYLAAMTRYFGMTDLERLAGVEGIELESERFENMMQNMPGFSEAMATITRDFFKKDEDHFVFNHAPREADETDEEAAELEGVRNDDSPEDIRRKARRNRQRLHNRQQMVENQEDGWEDLVAIKNEYYDENADEGDENSYKYKYYYGEEIVADADLYQKYKEELIQKIAAKLGQEDGNLVESWNLPDVEWLARAAVASVDNFNYATGVYNSADERRKVLGNDLVYAEQIRQMMMPGV